LLTTPLYLLCLTNMLPLSPNSAGASLHQTLGFLPPSVHFDPPSAMLKTSGNVLTLLLTGPPSSLSATSTTSLSCLPKKSTIPASYLQPPITPSVFGKQSNPPNRYRPLLLALHLTALPLFSPAKYPNSVSLTSNSTTSSPHSLHHHPPATPPDFSVFTPASESEVHKILSNCQNKQSDSDPIPTWLLKECSSILVPTSTNIVNLSLTTGQFHPTLNESIISPLLKKPTLDKEELSSYRPISNLSLISKIIERVVKSRLTDHLTSNSLQQTSFYRNSSFVHP